MKRIEGPHHGGVGLVSNRGSGGTGTERRMMMSDEFADTSAGGASPKLLSHLAPLFIPAVFITRITIVRSFVMKNLSAIPRLSHFATFTILITLAVCLPGFAGAEVRAGYKKESDNEEGGGEMMSRQSLQKEWMPNLKITSKAGDGDLSRQAHFVNYLKSLKPEGAMDRRLMTRESKDLKRESEEFDDESDKDGYGYDDDEYYHFDFKRNDEPSSGAAAGGEKEGVQEETEKKQTLQNQKFGPAKVLNEKNKESETVEMLSFKESHPKPASEESLLNNALSKPFAQDPAHKKLPSDPGNSLKMSDLRKNSAIEEKIKDRKDEAPGMNNGGEGIDSKVAEAKKNVKDGEVKDALKLKDSKFDERPEEKVKEVNVKDSKERVSSKASKETAKGVEDKEKSSSLELKNLKDSDNERLIEADEKMTSEAKEGEVATAAKDDRDKENSKFSHSDSVNSNEISQINNRANFVSNDYKDNGDSSKTPIEEDENSSEEMNDKNVGLNDYQEDFGQMKESLREDESKRSFDYRGTKDNSNAEDTSHSTGKTSDSITLPIAFEVKDDNLGEWYSKQNGWKNRAKLQNQQILQQQQQQQQQLQKLEREQSRFDQQLLQQQQRLAYEHPAKAAYELGFPASELENTDYHKNYIKYLRRYKGLDDNTNKVLSTENTRSNRSAHKQKPSDVEKRSKGKRKTSVPYGGSAGASEEKRGNSISSRNSYSKEDPTERSALSKLFQTDKFANGCPSRQRRKSPPKLEYEIKIINQNQQDSKNVPVSKLSQKRRKKDVKTKSNDPLSEKIVKKYPYSQVSRDDLTRFEKETSEKKIKRKAPWKGRDHFEGAGDTEENSVKSRGAPSGYYTNRVKFGQKHFVPEDARQSDNDNSLFSNKMSSFFGKKAPSDMDVNFLQRSWRDSKSQNVKHDPIKRFDDNAVFGKGHNENSLLLVKKDRNGDRIAKTFVDASRSENEADFSSDQLARILSKDNDYIVLKKTEKNKFQKVEGDPSHGRSIADGQSVSSKAIDLLELNPQGGSRDSGKHSRGLFIRSYRSNEQDSHGAKSGLKKTFEKFKDLADFFKENEPDTSDGQRSSSQVKEGSEIVFSTDKMPDPIVISNDLLDSKSVGLKSKSPNSMTSISTNFKQLDQDSKKTDTMKFEEPGKEMLAPEKSAWEPALKTAFPEAKSINSMQKNGNEIIVLDFDRNHLKTEQGNRVLTKAPFEGSNENLYLPFGSVQKVPGSLLIPGNRQVEVVLNEGSLPTFLEPEGNKNSERKFQSDKMNNVSPNQEQEKVVSVVSGPDGQAIVTMPLNQFAQLPLLLKQYAEKKSNAAGSGLKSIVKKSATWPSPDVNPSASFSKFLRDYRELSEINREALPKKAKINNKRSSSLLPPSSFPELSSYGDANVKYLGSLIQNILNNENSPAAIESGRQPSNLENKQEISKNIGKDFEQSLRWQARAAEYDGDYDPVSRHQNQWISNDERRKAFVPLRRDADDYLPEDISDDIFDLLRSGETQDLATENEYQNELMEELSEASDKIQRLRRENVNGDRLRRIMEDALPYRSRRSSEHDKRTIADSKQTAETNKKKRSGEGTGKNSNDRKADREDDEKNKATSKRNVQNGDESKNKSEPEKQSIPEREENDAKKLTENIKSAKGQTDELSRGRESTGSRRNRRRKRSPESDFKTKVSNSEVENKILKKSEEGNYKSVYSPGIRRKLLSIDDETEGAGEYYGADESERKDRKNAIKHKRSIDPILKELFEEEESELKENGNAGSFPIQRHNNYKREIDLDESMPNDFQNFLETSLGLDSHVTGFGGQKREIVKKGEALWEGKGNSPDNYNQIIGKDTNDDSSLEKREVSTADTLKRKNYKSYYDAGNGAEKAQSPGVVETGNRGNPKSKLQDKSSGKGKSQEFSEAKVPTQIRIQITKASAKKKKSSKPADDTETASAEIELLPKDKDGYDNKKYEDSLVSPAQSKSYQVPKYKYSFNVRDTENAEDPGQPNPYPVSRRRARRKKKKFVQENPMKPVKDFIAFDQKAMESLIRKYFADQTVQRNMNQKAPASNHLPQVETVYNPTQGTNKAQIGEYKPMSKVNSLNNKNVANAKNLFNIQSKTNLQSNELSTYDEALLRSFLKDKPTQVKGSKEGYKEFEDVEWKMPYSGLRLRMDATQNTQGSGPTYKTTGTDPPYNNVKFETVPGSTTYSNPLKCSQIPNNHYNNYFSSDPSPYSQTNTDSGYDPTQPKLEGQAWNAMNKDPNLKNWRKITVMSGTPEGTKYSKEKSPSGIGVRADSSWNAYDRYHSNKPVGSEKYKFRDTYGGRFFKNEFENALKPRYSSNNYKYVNAYGEEKPPMSEPCRVHDVDNSKETDYSDSEEEYSDGDEMKRDPQSDEPGADARGKESKIYEFNKYGSYPGYKDAEADGRAGEDDDEVEEDYSENNDELSDDYSLLGTSDVMRAEMNRKPSEGQKLKDSYYADDSLRTGPDSLDLRANDMQIKGNTFERAEFRSTKNDENLDPASNQMTYFEMKNDVDPFTNSMSVLKKANENSNVLEKNLMDNLNKYAYESEMKNSDQPQMSKMSYRDYRNPSHWAKRKTDRRNKLKRNQGLMPIGSRLFYAVKSESYDAQDMPREIHQFQRRNNGNAHHPSPKRNPLDAELRSPENEFEYESEDNSKHFTGTLVNGDKTEKDARDVEDVKENLEDDGENISEDNVLENVIGKYIMRKSVKVKGKDEPKGARGSIEDDCDLREECRNAKERGRHKRSLDEPAYSENLPKAKVSRKRLSAGHLTENNFKKYHKKNLTRKRHARTSTSCSETHISSDEAGSDVDSPESAQKTSFEEDEDDIMREDESEMHTNRGTEMKRSALSLFKKIGNKDKESKKEEGVDVRTVGFEPIFSSPDSRYESSSDERQEPSVSIEKAGKEPHSRPSNVTGETEALEKKTDESNEIKDRSNAGKMEGPWKVDLNELAESSLAEDKNALAPTKDREASARGASRDVKAYLVIRKNVRAAEKSHGEALSPTSEATKTEVGNSYLPKLEKGAGNSKKNLRKRSEESSVEKDDPTTSPENPLSKPEMNRALQDRKSLSGGDSNSQAPQVMPRNTEGNATFVNARERRQSSGVKQKFLSNGRLKRKSVFPLSSDANIIGDNRHVDEETSRYLGQQIVDAILARATTNQRFKELIAPGLPGKPTVHHENSDDRKRALNRLEYPEQVQSLLQKVVFDIEKIAEQHVKKRMCNKIDKQSKEFLYSLLQIPPEKCRPEDERSRGPEECPNTFSKSCVNSFSNHVPLESGKTSHYPQRQTTQTPDNFTYKQKIFDTLKRKQRTLLRLIDDYQRLSEVERQAINVSFQYLQSQLDETNRLLSSLGEETKDYCVGFGNRGLENRDQPQLEAADKGIEGIVTSKCSPKNSSDPCAETNISGPIPQVTTTEASALVYEFDPSETEKNSTEKSETFTPKVYGPENANQDIKDQGFEDVSPKNENPESFDLLGSQNSSNQSESPDTTSTGSVRIKQSIAGDFDNRMTTVTPNALYKIPEETPGAFRPSELHKLGTGDAAGLQLSLKYRGPWVSNLEMAKDIINIRHMCKPSLPPTGLSALESDSATPDSNNHLYETHDNHPHNLFDQSSFGGDPKTFESGFVSSRAGFEDFPADLEKRLQYNKKGFYPSPHRNHVYTPIQNFFKNLNRPPLHSRHTPSRSRVFISKGPFIDSRGSYRMRKSTTKRFCKANKKKKKFHGTGAESRVTENDSDFEETPGLAYLIWSSMPSVRRRLNKLELGVELHKPLDPNSRQKKFSKSEPEPAGKTFDSKFSRNR